MRSILALLLSTLTLLPALAEDGAGAVKPAPVLTVDSSINPGVAAYLSRGIENAERDGAPYVVIQLDTPGGLLSTTRLIVQKMLGARLPVVVFVGPRGAQAGSAGALITYAANVAAMAPGTNIGAAHPIAVGGGKDDRAMREKVVNDTAAFAESLARAHGRSTEWAARSVKMSASLPADEALKNGLVDLVAADLPELAAKLSGLKLKVPKAGPAGALITALPTGAATTAKVAMTLSQRLVSFFSDPTLAYLILSFGALCLWIELTHPGLILPGVLAALAFIVSLVSFQMMPIDYGALALLLVGLALLVTELFVPAFGALGIGGIACFVIGSLFLMDTTVPEFRISLSVILPTAAALAGTVFFLGVLLWRTRNAKVRSGMGALVGEFGEIREPVSPSHPGQVFVQGELWKAVTNAGDAIPTGTLVVVEATKEMTLIVAPRPVPS